MTDKLAVELVRELHSITEELERMGSSLAGISASLASLDRNLGKCISGRPDEKWLNIGGMVDMRRCN